MDDKKKTMRRVAIAMLALGVWAIGSAVVKVASGGSALGAAALMAGVVMVAAAGIALKLRAARPKPMPFNPEPSRPQFDPITQALGSNLDQDRSLADQTGFFSSMPADSDPNLGRARPGGRPGSKAAPNKPDEDSSFNKPIVF